jgi:hypothetical protein
MTAAEVPARHCSTIVAAQRRRRRVVLSAIAVWCGFMGPCWLAAGTAAADPGGPSCPPSMVLMCRFMPIAPDLDDDVDLTSPQSSVEVTPPVEQSAGDPGAPLPDPNPPDD